MNSDTKRLVDLLIRAHGMTSMGAAGEVTTSINMCCVTIEAFAFTQGDARLILKTDSELDLDDIEAITEFMRDVESIAKANLKEGAKA